jgi:hypothetical protein
MIYVGFTTGGGPPTWPLFWSALGLRVPGGRWRYIAGDPGPTDWARNDLVYQFLDNDDGEWLLQIDRDALFHPRTLERLMSWDKKAIAPVFMMRGIPPMPAAWTMTREDPDKPFGIDPNEWLEWFNKYNIKTNKDYLLDPAPEDSLRRVKRCGMHLFLAHRSVYEAISPPWFGYNDPLERTAGNQGEDFYFCEQLEQAGIPLYVDRSVGAGHSAGERSIGPVDFVAYTSILKSVGG